MKKTILNMMAVALLGMMAWAVSACQGCDGKGGGEVPFTEDPELAQVEMFTVPVETQIAIDREHVWMNYGQSYRWYETMVLFEHFFDSEDTDFSLLEVVSVFQCEQIAVKCQHFDGMSEYGYAYAIWVGDMDMSEEEINLTFKEAYERMQQANVIKPHGRYCVLRREMGPKPGVAPQYVFGNEQGQVYVDAKTGDVTDKNPAFEGFEE